MASDQRRALGVLSGLSADELRFAVLADDVKTISRGAGNRKENCSETDPGTEG